MRKIFLCCIFAACTAKNGTSGAAGLQGAQGQAGANGAVGANGTNGADGTNGTNGADGTNGTNGAAGTNGTNGPPGPVDATGPNAPSFLRLSPSPLGPPNYDLAWTPPGNVALSAMNIYMSQTKVSAKDTLALIGTAAGSATHYTVQLSDDSGPWFFAVSAVSYTGVEGQMAQTNADTSARWFFTGDSEVGYVDDDTQLEDTTDTSIVVSPNDTFVALAGASQISLLTPIGGTTTTAVTIDGSHTAAGLSFSPDTTSSGLSSPAAAGVWTYTQGAGALAYVLTDTGDSSTSLFVYDLATNTSQKVAGDLTSYAWAPDGSALLVVEDNGSGQSVAKTISMIDGSSIDWTTVGPQTISANIESASFSADGRFIAMLVSDGGSHSNVYIADVGTQRTSRLDNDGSPIDVDLVAWSPVADVLATSRATILSLVPVSGIGVTKLANGSGVVTALDWSPDGGALTALGASSVIIYPSDTNGGASPVVYAASSLAGFVRAPGSGWSADSQRYAYVLGAKLEVVTGGSVKETSYAGFSFAGSPDFSHTSFAWTNAGHDIGIAVAGTPDILDINTDSASPTPWGEDFEISNGELTALVPGRIASAAQVIGP